MTIPKPLCLSFRQCFCGIEYRITNRPDGKAQTIRCRCRLIIKIVGTVLAAYSGRCGSFSDRDWVVVSWERIRGPEDALAVAVS